jgi:hypothetical protein
MTTILALLIAMPAQAGWFSDFCQRHLIADDPYQFEQTSENLLVVERYRYSLRIRNGIATNRDRALYRLLDDELKRRGHP